MYKCERSRTRKKQARVYYEHMVYGSEEREIPHTTIVDILVYMNKRPCKKNIPFVLFSQKPLLHNTAVPLPLLSHNLFPFYFTKTIPFIDFFSLLVKFKLRICFFHMFAITLFKIFGKYNVSIFTYSLQSSFLTYS